MNSGSSCTNFFIHTYLGLSARTLIHFLLQLDAVVSYSKTGDALAYNRYRTVIGC